MNAQRTTALVMAKMALSDGVIADEERAFLTPMLAEGETVDDLLEEAKGKSVQSLVGDIDNYADRFFIALRAASMAHVDAHLDAREEALLQELVTVLEVTEGDQALIQAHVSALESIEPVPTDPRLQQLYGQSSFV